MKKRILIIEDDNDILEILKLTFEDEDYEIIGFNKRPNVLDVLAISPNLILLDIRFFGSKKNGAMLCRELKTEVSTNHIPVLLLSAEHRLPQITNECGADGYITKPFDINLLEETVSKYLLKATEITDVSMINSTENS